MSSVALAQTATGRDARADTQLMAAAMADRSVEWAHAGVPAVAVTAGAEDSATAAGSVFTLAGGALLAGVSAPSWVHWRMESVISDLDVTDSPEKIAAKVSAVTGDAHCVVASPDQRWTVVYRSPMSARPLFYSAGHGSVLVASQIRGLRAANPGIGVDPVGLAPFLVPSMCDPAGSAWAGVRRLPPGHALIVRDGAATVHRAGHIDAEDVAGLARGDVVAEFRARLLVAMQRCSSPTDAVLLSGGIDSASLAAAAVAGGLRRRPRAFALTYSTEELAACDERRYVDAVEQATGIPVVRMPADTLLPLAAEYPFGDEPEAWTYAGRNWAMLRRIAADPDPVGSVIAGEGGDELLLGQVFTVADRRVNGDVDGAMAELATFPDPAGAARVVDGLIAGDYERRGTRVMRALGDIPPWLSPSYISASGLVDRLTDGYPTLSEPGQFTTAYSRALIGEAGAAGRVHCGGWWEDTARRAGVRVTYPFLDPDLAALTWALPPEMLRKNGIEKVVLRDALADELPASVAARRDKADARVMMHAGLSRAANSIRAVAAGGPLVDRGVIDGDKLSVAIDKYLAGHHDHGPALWATVAVNSWLEHVGESE
ncbi:asparagine synthase-related protein [Nocardia salmonicida]|uniref:asparagine synthase-related protein n=1 Tax=Nocardia salmonicida TaxID=53431 RepID=UPI000A079758|nr:asparagine synthase-related protein [Nocardia salmonicida]